MKTSEFVERLCIFARNTLAPKCANPMTKLALGAASCGIGRRIVEKRIVPFLEMATDENGNVDLSGIRESLTTGFGMAKSVPLLGGAISIDQSDVDAFFASLN